MAKSPAGFTEVGIPDLGMDTDTVPRLLSPRKAPLLKNFLMDRPGILPMRGPICEGTSWDVGASLGLIGSVIPRGDQVAFVRAAGSGTATRDYWVAPYRKATAENQLRACDNHIHVVDLATGTHTDLNGGSLGFSEDLSPSGRPVRAGQTVYAVASDANHAGAPRSIQQDGGYHLLRPLVYWKSGALSTAFVPIANGPYAAQDVAVHYNRLFVLGGTTPASLIAPINFNTLYWSDFLASDGILTDALNSWKDDVTGLVNQIVIGSNDDSDFGVALAHVGSNLCILKRRSVWMLYGTSSANFVVKQVSSEVGCIDPRSVVEYADGVYFMAEQGFMFFDGTRVHDVSEGLSSTLVANAIKQVGPAGVDGGFVRASHIGRGYIQVTTGAMNNSTLVATTDTDAWLYHVPSGAWLQFSSDAMSAPVGAGRTINHTFLLSDQKLVKANYLFNPDAAPDDTRGIDSIDNGATKFVIPSRWTSRTLTLASPLSFNQLERVVVDYYWTLDNSNPRSGWNVAINTRSPLGIANPSTVFPAPSQYGGSLPTRGSLDCFSETDETYLDITATAPTPATFTRAEIHRAVVQSKASYRTSTVT